MDTILLKLLKHYHSPEIVHDLLPSSIKGVDFENISYDSKCNAASSILLELVLKNRSLKCIDMCS